MKKNNYVKVVVVALVAVVTFSVGVINAKSINHTQSMNVQSSCQGAHCNGTVGCSCPGFVAKTNGDVWEQSYCKHCGHKKSSHK